jgi:hypothetical protein
MTPTERRMAKRIRELKQQRDDVMDDYRSCVYFHGIPVDQLDYDSLEMKHKESDTRYAAAIKKARANFNKNGGG